MSSNKVYVINAEGCILGRLASYIAKRLLSGDKIVVVNAEKAIVTGRKREIIERYKRRLRWRTYYNPEKRGPKIPKRPDRVFKRTVRGMLPYKKEKGRTALKNLKVYIGVPEEYANVEYLEVPEAKKDFLKTEYLTLEEIAYEMGWRRNA
ncbi:MAG: 50S ribosomal protein L13 [Thermofilum sp. ex4484_79]|nr:MAG: 50S ribosomal protein L13 [Thermofilum sp. ex4484_79]